MGNENLKHLKSLIKYSDLLTTTLMSLIIPIIGLIIWGIILFLYRETGSGDLLSPLSETILIITPLCILAILGIYYAIRFSLAKNKLSQQDYSNLNVDSNQINDNMNKANSINTIHYMSDILKVDKTNIGLALNSLTFISAISLFSKNNKILKEHNEIFDSKEKKLNNITKISIIIIILIFSVLLNGFEVISSQNNKEMIQNNINSLNAILKNNFYDYQIHGFNGQSVISTKNFDTFGREYYIQNNNYKINFELNNKALIKEFSFDIMYNNDDVLNEIEISNKLNNLKDKFDSSFSSYYLLKEYESSEIILNNECSNIINNKTIDTISIDKVDVNKPLRYFSIHNTNERLEVSYSFRSYVD